MCWNGYSGCIGVIGGSGDWLGAVSSHVRQDMRLVAMFLIIVPNIQLSLAKKSFAWRGSETWNSLPFELRTCTRIGIFKNGAKQWVMNSIQDFLD